MTLFKTGNPYLVLGRYSHCNVNIINVFEGFPAKNMRWNQQIFWPRIWAEISWFSGQEYELKSEGFPAKNMSWNQLIFWPRLWAEIRMFSSQEYEMKSADFLAKKTSWNQLIFWSRIWAEIRRFSSQEYEMKSATTINIMKMHSISRDLSPI